MITLDALFRRSGVRNAHAAALVDPPNRAAVTDGAPRTLTFAAADRAISAFAVTLRALGLPTGAVVALQLPHTVDSVIACLGTLRAGLIAAPVPLLWRRRDMVEALGRVGAKAIVTAGRIGACRHAELACEVAADLFPIRQICAFGTALPDGVVPLDGIFATTTSEPPPHRAADAAQRAFFIFPADGGAPVALDHRQCIAAGAEVVRTAGLAADTAMLSTIPLASSAGLSLTLVPWLIGGGPLHLHHGFDAAAFAAQAASLSGGAVVVPGPALPALAGDLAAAGRVIALWRAPLGAAADARVPGLVDAVCRDDGQLDIAARDADGRVDSGIVAAAADAVAPGLFAIGGYQFRPAALDAAIASVDPAAVIAALPDAVLGQRLAGHAPDAAAVAAALTAHGHNPLLAQAFRTRAPLG